MKHKRSGEVYGAALRVCMGGRDYRMLTIMEVAVEVGDSRQLVAYHGGGMLGIRRGLMRLAVDTEALPVVAQGLVARDPIALAAPQELRVAALRAVCS